MTGQTQPHTYLCRTRWGDIDQFGHVNNVRYVQFVQESLVDLLYQGRQPCDGPMFREGFLIVHHDVDYRAQLKHSDRPIPISVWVPRVGRSSFDVHTELCRDEEVVLTARTVVVARDATTGRSRPMNPAELAYLRSFQPQPAAEPAREQAQEQVAEPSAEQAHELVHRGPVHRDVRSHLHLHRPATLPGPRRDNHVTDPTG